jgi:hypothetical protein
VATPHNDTLVEGHSAVDDVEKTAVDKTVDKTIDREEGKDRHPQVYSLL